MKEFLHAALCSTLFAFFHSRIIARLNEEVGQAFTHSRIFLC